ncbi:SdpI family protein [Desulfosporosinus sp. OT]|uniref:SdpI family protein n=1 Tax=Desulfosporosinus sp. OT TaxID=913865 RepID=UPI000223A6CC|nr:SdpI family protein [Desulfosporosinus sp. OT]EGW41907.1 hypothetical protein DOT_0117 [Desulfosporosinus sp. OT]
MKNEKMLLRLMWAIAMLPVIVTVFVFDRLPEQIPMHWNIYGQVNAWHPKFPWIFLMPVIGILITIMATVLPRIDPKKENYERFKPQYFIIRLILVVFFAIMHMVIISISLGATFIKVDTIIKLMVGILFIVLGNLMPKFKQNYFVGIKTPWTLANEVVWAKSHRHGGFVWFITGFVLSVLAFLPGKGSAIAYFVLILLASIEPILYSWIQFRKQKLG